MSADTEQKRFDELLAAGVVLPPDTEGAGEHVVPLTARTYRHPGLDDRIVVRVVAGELGAAEDLAAGFLGLETEAEPVVVGLGLRQALGFPEWVLVHHPEDGHHALGVVPELERAARQVKSKPKAALDAYLELADRLAVSVPHFLPTFYEQAGRVFLTEENATYASQMFTRARKAEAEHGLALDEERLDAVFLEFALAGALPVKVLSAYAKELAARVPAEEALSRFTRLCLRRTAGGLPPSTQMAGDLRKLARAAGQDAGAVEESYLAELMTLPATARAAMGWWKGHRAAIVALARREPAVRGALLNMIPGTSDSEMPPLWLEILDGSGATAALYDSTLPEEQQPQDGAAGWLKRFTDFAEHSRRWNSTTRQPTLYPHVERAADRLRTELASSGRALEVFDDLDLIDLLLSLEVPVADPGEDHRLWLEQWARSEGQRDLLALSADPRFRPAFNDGADRLDDDEDGLTTLRLLARSPGGRPMLVEWVRTVAKRSTAAGLPQLPGALARLKWLPAEVLALAEEEARAATSTDLAPLLARTLRAGLFDELGWPAWEEAATELVPKKDVEDLYIADAWPHLIVAGGTQARVIDADGTVLTHDLRQEARDGLGDPGFHHVDGHLLVHWRTRDDGLRGYWHTSPDRIERLTGANSTRGTEMNWYRANLEISLPLPGGGRTTGGGVLHAGDTTLPAERTVISDGVSYWTWTRTESDDSAAWHEYDPATGQHGRKGMPAFLADALRDAPAGSTLLSGWLLPAPSPEAAPACSPVNGLVGWRVVELPDGTRRGEDLAGHTVTLPKASGTPSLAVRFPGDETPRAVVRRYYEITLVDPDGVVTSVAKTDGAPGVFAEGSPLLPPVQYWEFLRPRDPRGSEALRRIDRDTAEALLKAAGDKELLPDAIRSLLGVTHDALVAGIAGVVRHAAGQQAVLDAAAARLTQALDGALQDEGPAGPADSLLNDAISGLREDDSYWSRHRGNGDTVFRRFRTLGNAVRQSDEPVPDGRPAVRLHLDGPELPTGTPDIGTVLHRVAAFAFRAAAETTAPEHRDALEALLREIDGLGLASAAAPARWRRVSLHLEARHVLTPSGDWRDGNWQGVLPLGGGAFVAVVATERQSEREGCRFIAYVHDPAGRFEVPAPYTVRSSDPVGEDREAGWLGAFLTELAERGPAPWFPEAAGEFARLTGVTETMARLVVAGLPQVSVYHKSFLSAEARTTLGVKVAEATMAKDELRRVDEEVRRAVVAALLPSEPARLWTDGPDVAAAAAVWIAAVGRRTAVPEALLAEAVRGVRPTAWDVRQALPALLEPAAAPQLSRDLEWAVSGDRVRPVGRRGEDPEDPEDGNGADGFTADTLAGAVPLAAWLAHRVPVGDAVRAALPAALAAIRARLAHPGLVLDLGRYVNLPEFRKAAGAPTETGDGFERYGAVIMSTHDDQPAPGLRTALLDAAGHDPYLPALRLEDQQPFPAEVAFRIARDPRFEALLADPGDPAAGQRGKDGTWWPQDPSRSVPELVTDAAKEYGVSEDAATLYLTLLAMPDPTDRNTARWTGWQQHRGGAARLKSARAELAGTGLVVEATRARAGRSLFLPGGWTELKAPHLPLEQWKLPLYGDLVNGRYTALGVIAPMEPAADLYRRAWQRVRDGDAPRFEELKTPRGRRRR